MILFDLYHCFTWLFIIGRSEKSRTRINYSGEPLDFGKQAVRVFNNLRGNEKDFGCERLKIKVEALKTLS